VNGQLSPLSREILRVHTALAIQTPESVTSEVLAATRNEIGALSGMITQTYLR